MLIEVDGFVLRDRFLCYNTDMAIERLVEPTLNEDNTEEEKIEISLRPTTFAEYIGQEHLKNNFQIPNLETPDTPIHLRFLNKT